MVDELNQLKLIDKGVGKIIQDFAIDELFPDEKLGNLNWEVKDGTLDPGVNGQTDPKYDAENNINIVTTVFDSGKFNNSSDISTARTVLHEAVHAYVVSIAYSKATSAIERENLLGPDWINAFKGQGHDFMAGSYINQIAVALEAFGNSKGYNLSRQFYEDMSWGGLLTTTEFQAKSQTEKNRIENVILIEQSGRDKNGNYKSQKGSASGC